MVSASLVLGDTHILMILREAFYGVRRFVDFQRDLGLSRATLTNRLKRLVDAGVLHTSTYKQDGRRSRKLYELTERGRDLLPLIIALTEWGEGLSGQAPIQFINKEDGSPVRIGLVSKDGNEVETANVGFDLRVS